MTKISKKKAVELILAEMDKGIVDAPTILGKLGKGGEISKSSYYRAFKEAELAHSERQQSIQEEIDKERIDAEKRTP